MSMRRILAAAALAFVAAAGAPAHPPYGLVADPSGSVYFSDLETVWRVAPDGRLSVFRPHVPGTHVHELALAPDGAIEGDLNRYDPATQRFYTGLWRRSGDGRERMLVPLTERAPPGFGVWQDKRGNRYTAFWPSNEDRRTMLARRTRDGRSKLVFAEGRPPKRAVSGVASVGGFAFAADGSLFFAERNMLRRLAPDGRVSLVHRASGEASLRGLSLAPDGRVIAADMGRRLVLAVSARGQAETLYTSPIGWTPTAAAVVRGRLLVLEANGEPREYVDRVRLVEATRGGPRVLARPGARAETAGDGARPLETSGAALAGGAAAAAAAGAALFLLWRARTRH